MFKLSFALLLSLIVLSACNNLDMKAADPVDNSGKKMTKINGTVTFLKVIANQIFPSAHAAAPAYVPKYGPLCYAKWKSLFESATNMTDVMANIDAAIAVQDQYIEKKQGVSYSSGVVLAFLVGKNLEIKEIYVTNRNANGTYSLEVPLEKIALVQIVSVFPSAGELVYREALKDPTENTVIHANMISTIDSMAFQEKLSEAEATNLFPGCDDPLAIAPPVCKSVKKTIQEYETITTNIDAQDIEDAAAMLDTIISAYYPIYEAGNEVSAVTKSLVIRRELSKVFTSQNNSYAQDLLAIFNALDGGALPEDLDSNGDFYVLSLSMQEASRGSLIQDGEGR